MSQSRDCQTNSPHTNVRVWRFNSLGSPDFSPWTTYNPVWLNNQLCLETEKCNLTIFNLEWEKTVMLKCSGKHLQYKHLTILSLWQVLLTDLRIFTNFSWLVSSNRIKVPQQYSIHFLRKKGVTCSLKLNSYL